MSYHIYLLLIVGVGGALGTMLRFSLSNWIQHFFELPLYPLATSIANVFGCFLIGVVASITETRVVLNAELRSFIQIGILGGFTTFSSFGYETFSLMHSGEYFLACSNVLIQVLLGLAAVWLGYYLAQ